MAQGNVYRRGETWSARFDAGRDPRTGKRKQQTKGGFRTRDDAQKWIREQLRKLDKGTYVPMAKILVGDYLTGWLAATRASRKPSTHESYERMIRQHLIPRLGHVQLQSLAPEHLSIAFAEMARTGHLKTGEALSPRMVRYGYTVLRKALQDALEEGKISRNVAALSTVRKRLPRKIQHQHHTWTAQELSHFLDVAQDDDLGTAYLLAATTGMRRGEVLGLRWQDVDLDAGRVAVRQTLGAVRDVDSGSGAHVPTFGTPKTDKQRVVPIPARMVKALKIHHQAQLQEMMEQKRPARPVLVFEYADGSPIHPERFTKRFVIISRKAELPPIRVHDLRHTFATLALQAGVHVKVVSEILGHANISITLDTYSHVIPSMREDAAETVAALLV